MSEQRVFGHYDALRFKEKLQSLSQSAKMNENMMAKSPMEQDLDSDAGE